MLSDIGQLPSGAVDAGDVLIVGAGAVGITLGLSLARAGQRTTILEAGDEQPPSDYRAVNRATLSGRRHLGALEGRMRALGGTTRLWGGQLVPFDAADMAGDPATGRRRWPIDHAELLPWFAAAFAILGVDPEASDSAEVWRRATGRSQTFGDSLTLGMNIWLPQPDFTRLFAAELRETPGLNIVTRASVEALQLDSTGGRVVAVEAGHGANRRRFTAPRIVLANGTLEIVRLLLRTAATAPACGFADNAAIGAGFIDHLHGIAGTIEVGNAGELRQLFDNVYWHGRKYGVKMRASKRLRLSRGIANGAATLYTPTNIGSMVRDLLTLGRRLVRGHGGAGVGRGIADASRMARILLPIVWRYVVARRSTSLFSQGLQLGVELEQLETPRSRLTLDPAFPPETAPIALHWELGGREIDAVAAICEAVETEFAARGLGAVTIDPRVIARDPAFLDTCNDAYHQMGGARMGETASEAVVDRDLRVFGCDNLYVAGAATFPTGSFANPTLTAIALGLRLADHLAREEPPPC